MAHRFLTKRAYRNPWRGIPLAAGLGGASGLMHSEGRPTPALAAGAAGGTLGALPGYAAGSAIGAGAARHLSRSMRGGGLMGAAIGGTAGVVAGGALGGRFSDAITGIVPGDKNRASTRIAAWLKDREASLGSLVGPVE